MNSRNSESQYKIQSAIVYTSHKLSQIKKTRKPVLLHSIRVGMMLYEQSYDTDIVIAGYLHDIIEDTDVSPEKLRQKFGEGVTSMVIANTKNAQLTDPAERHDELIRRCLYTSQNAAIVKAADILDNYSYYTSLKDKSGISYCHENVKLFRQYLHDDYTDKIFDQLFNTVS